MSSTHVGVLGVGVYLPSTVRGNDWWPQDVVDAWRAKSRRQAEVRNITPKTPGQEQVLRAWAALKDDVFQGARERRVMAAGDVAATMEVAAAREALEQAQVPATGVDLLLTYTACPEVLCTNQAPTVHEALGLPEACLSMSVDSSCNSFMHQLSIATAMIRTGSARRALLVQSCSVTPLLPTTENFSAWFGDGATAVVVGTVQEGYGILGQHHLTDGSLQDTLVASVPGGSWFSDGPAILQSRQPLRVQRMFMETADTSRTTIAGALGAARISEDDVDFYACHQGTAWLRAVTHQHAGLHRARSVDTFSWAGSLSAANVPLVLAVAQREGHLRDGDVVVGYSGGSGITSSSFVVRWGGK